MRHLTAVPVLLTLLGWGAVARAQSPEPEDVERAEESYLEAVEAFKSGEARRAAELFHESWELMPKPELLYNEAIAWADAGEVRRAHQTALAAAEAELPPKMRVRNEARIRAWSLRFTAEDTSATVAARPAETEESETTEPTPEPTPEAAAVEATRPQSREGSGGKVAGIALGVAGLAGLATSGVMAWQVDRTGQLLDRAARARDRSAYDHYLQRGERLQTVGIASLAAGGALLGTGVVVWLISGSTEPPQQTVMIGFDGTALSATVHFR